MSAIGWFGFGVAAAAVLTWRWLLPWLHDLRNERLERRERRERDR